MLSKVWQKMVETLLDSAVSTSRTIRDFWSTFEDLQRNSASLIARASDVEEQIKNAELSGKKKRKREVELWLEEVQTLEREIRELQVEEQGFIKKFIGGDRAAQLNARIEQLYKQSQDFGELLDMEDKVFEVPRKTGAKMSSKVWEKTVEALFDSGLSTARTIRDFGSTFEDLQRNSASFIATASDVEEHIKNAELSGKKKRKREVELWLEEVQTLEREIRELQVEEQGFIKKFIGGDRAAQLNARIEQLYKQSQDFGELLDMEDKVFEVPRKTGAKMSSKVWEKTVEALFDSGLSTARTIRDFGSTFEDLQRNSASFIARASDVEEHIKNAELSGKKKRKSEVVLWLEEVQTLEREIRELQVEAQGFIKFFGGGRAAQLNARIEQLRKQSQDFGEVLLPDVGEPIKVTFLTPKLVGEAFQKNFESIWKLLVSDKVPSIGIYGMGGVGKTTLAKHINNRLIEQNQGRVIWVTVSQECSIRGLQDEIAHLLQVDLSDYREEGKRAAMLNHALSALTQKEDYVLIFDDVWENISLEKLGDPLCVEGCRLVITSRSSKVCHQINCKKVIEVKTLQEDEAWILFKDTLGHTVLAPEVEGTAKLVAKKCDGLPVGLIILAGSMRGKTTAYAWRNTLDELKESSVKEQHDMEDKVFKVLRYSYDQLAKSGFTALQRCFLHCALWPEDFKIPRSELIRIFMLEELVDKRKSRRAQFDQGNDMLDELVNVCLLESTTDSHKVACVKIHDLIRSMALRITQGKTIVLAGLKLKEIPNNKEWPINLETMSLMENNIEEIQSGASPSCPRLSMLLLNSNRDLESIDHSFFKQMRGLSILDLSNTGIKRLPDSISELERLKALLLGNCQSLVYVPNLGNLSSLRELDLSNTGIRSAPRQMERLVNLNWLSLDGAGNLKLRRCVVSKLINLRCLYLPTHLEAPIEEIERLGLLEEFGGRVEDMGGVDRFIKFRKSQLEHKGVPASYQILVGKARQRDWGGGSIADNRMILRGCNLLKDEIMLPEDIRHLELVDCMGLRRGSLTDCIHFSSWGSSSLETLEISSCGEIECFLTNGQLLAMAAALSESCSLPFRNLERIHLSQLSEFVGIINRVETSSPSSSTPPRQAVVMFSSLKEVSIYHCNKMKKLGLRLSDDQLPNLERFSVIECRELEEIIEIEEEEEEAREGQQQQLVSLPKLKYLGLVNNRSLKSICKPATLVIKCPSIEEIDLRGCPSLERRLPLYFAPPILDDNGELHYSSPSPALSRIWIEPDQKEWWESLEWDHPSHRQLLQPFLII